MLMNLTRHRVDRNLSNIHLFLLFVFAFFGAARVLLHTLLVSNLKKLHGSLLEIAILLSNFFRVTVFIGHVRFQGSGVFLELGDLISVKLVLVLVQFSVNIVDDLISSVSLLDEFSSLLILLGVLLSILDHVLDLVLAQTTRRLDNNAHFLASTLVSGSNVDDTVGINVEGNFDLWDTSRCWWDSGELEVTELLVIAGHFSLTLVDLDLDLGLTVSGSRVGLGLLGGDGGISHDELVHLATHDFDTERQRCNIKEKNVGDITGEDTALNGSTDGDSFI